MTYATRDDLFRLAFDRTYKGLKPALQAVSAWALDNF